MAIEKSWQAVPPQLFTVDGGQFGLITVTDASGFKAKQRVVVQSTTLGPLELQVKRVNSPTQLLLSPINTPLNGPKSQLNLSSYTVVGGAFIYAGEQPKSVLKPDDILQAIYRQEPGTTIGVELDDQFGNPIGPNNPLPVAFDGTITIGNVEVKGSTGNILEPNQDGSINVVITSGLGSSVVKSQYSETLSVASGATTALLTYSVAPGMKSSLQSINASGSNIAKFTVLLNGNPFDLKRTYFGGSVNVEFNYAIGTIDGYPLVAGDIVALQVLHIRPYVGDFEGRIQVLESEA